LVQVQIELLALAIVQSDAMLILSLGCHQPPGFAQLLFSVMSGWEYAADKAPSQQQDNCGHVRRLFFPAALPEYDTSFMQQR